MALELGVCQPRRPSDIEGTAQGVVDFHLSGCSGGNDGVTQTGVVVEPLCIVSEEIGAPVRAIPLTDAEGSPWCSVNEFTRPGEANSPWSPEIILIVGIGDPRQLARHMTGGVLLHDRLDARAGFESLLAQRDREVLHQLAIDVDLHAIFLCVHLGHKGASRLHHVRAGRALASDVAELL